MVVFRLNIIIFHLSPLFFFPPWSHFSALFWISWIIFKFYLNLSIRYFCYFCIISQSMYLNLYVYLALILYHFIQNLKTLQLDRILYPHAPLTLVFHMYYIYKPYPEGSFALKSHPDENEGKSLLYFIVKNSLSFLSLENVSTLPLYPKNIFAGYRIVGWECFFNLFFLLAL